MQVWFFKNALPLLTGALLGLTVGYMLGNWIGRMQGADSAALSGLKYSSEINHGQREIGNTHLDFSDVDRSLQRGSY